MAVEFVATKLAEAVVAQTIEKIADLLVHEAAALRGVRNDVESFQTELMRIKCFLEDADHKQNQDKRVRNWVAEVKDLACEIEDVVEIYIYKVHSSLFKIFPLHKLRTQINLIKEKLKSISESRQRYQIEFTSGEGNNNSLRDLRTSYPDDEEEDFISFKDTMAALKVQLMKEENRRCVVSIVGMGGLGKTTLAKKVYNDVEVKKHFDCCAWVYISQQCVKREVLSEILLQVGLQSDEHERINVGKKKYTKEFLEDRKKKREVLKYLEDHELVDLMKDELKDKRYLIVLDDIWSVETWKSFQNAFPRGKMGSKVVFTTRIETVALFDDPSSSPIKPPFLTPTESWELLQRKAFPRDIFGEHGCPTEFEELGKEMVRKCGGLPLAIVVLGGLLRTKNSLEGWDKVRKDVNSQFINKIESYQYRVEDILQLSFQDLPHYLKLCFLYLGTFPEDSEIPRKKLIRLWIAEGFVPTAGREVAKDKLMEDVAEQYLEELISRCMVQVAKRDHTCKGVKTCRLHDLVRDFCLSKGNDESFLEIIDQKGVHMMKADSSSVQQPSVTTHHSRRVSIRVNEYDRNLFCALFSLNQVRPNFRSLLYFGPPDLLAILYRKSFILLRLLDLDFLPKPTIDRKLPSEIGNLVHLRYLRLSGLVQRLILPRSIGNLLNLRTLDLKGNDEILLPRRLSRLIHLRHLLLPRWYSRTGRITRRSTLFGDYSLANIETLKGISAEDLINNGKVISLTNITVLEIYKFQSDTQVSLILHSLSSQIGCLRFLAMELKQYNFPNLELLSQCHDLWRLHLQGGLSIGNFSSLPKSLTKLILAHCLFDQDKLAVLGKLPHLRILCLHRDFLYATGQVDIPEYKWVCSDGGFPRLEILRLDSLKKLEEWEMEEGTMPYLKRLDIEYVPQLCMIPEGLEYVTTLQELNISAMTREFEDRIRVKDGVEGEDFHKVRHIPSISISNTLYRAFG